VIGFASCGGGVTMLKVRRCVRWFKGFKVSGFQRFQLKAHCVAKWLERLLVFCLVLFILPTAPLFAEEQMIVAVSVPPQRYFVEKIGGQHVSVIVIGSGSGCPESYEPRPQQMAEISRARIYFAIGFPFEDVWLPKFSTTNPGMIICHTDEGIKKIPLAGHVESDVKLDTEKMTPSAGSHAHGMFDPHIWLSPSLVRIQAQNITKALKKADPANADYYQKNLEKFDGEITALDMELRKNFGDMKPGKSFLVFHPSWGYFAAEYGLKQVPFEHEDREPSPREMMKLVIFAREKGLKVIFVQPQMSPKVIDTFAKEIGGQTVLIDPLAENWAENLKSVAVKIKDAAK